MNVLTVHFQCETCGRMVKRAIPDDGIFDSPRLLCVGPPEARHAEMVMCDYGEGVEGMNITAMPNDDRA